MMDLAIAFAWAFGLADWKTAQVLDLTETRVRKARARLGLRKSGGGVPA